MTDIEMLPLPEGLKGRGKSGATKDYARAVAEHNVRALREDLSAAKQMTEMVHEALRMSVANEVKAEARADELQADMATMEQHLVNAMGEVDRLDKRAERLAEALRTIANTAWNGVRPIQITARAALRDHDKGREPEFVRCGDGTYRAFKGESDD